MSCRFYIDEDVPVGLARSLEKRGIDVLTTQDAENIGKTDREQLEYANEQNRVFLTHNIRDFAILHKKYIDKGWTHSGIVVSDQLPIGTLLRRVLQLNNTVHADDIKNRLKYLSEGQ